MGIFESKTPITILNGFLGAGKTTILQRFLLQAQAEDDIELGVIVNEMSELDVDGRLINTNELLLHKDEKFTSISAGSISSERGLKEFTRAIEKIKHAGATHIIIETSGSTHPWPLIEAIRSHSGVALYGFLSVVDTVTLAQDHDLGRSIVPAVSKNLDAGKRGIENLLAEQIMFASRILMSKIDRVSPEILRKVAEAIHPINPWVDITGIEFGNIDLRDIISMPPYNYDRVAKLGAELAEWDEKHGCDTMSSASEYHID
ncbi:MAG: GTP-binding protein, partial [Pseudomonadota bacterium]